MAPATAHPIQVAVRVRPLNEREQKEGHRNCIQFDDRTKQVVLAAVDKNTLVQLHGQAAKGYAFDRRYGQAASSDEIYDDVINDLVNQVFRGYNGTVMAYGQTGSGKTHTMSGGVGIHGRSEEGIIPRVIRQVYDMTEAIAKKAKTGETIAIVASALELYNEDLIDLSHKSGRGAHTTGGWGKNAKDAGLKLQERPGTDGRIVPEVLGINEVECKNSKDMNTFFSECMSNRSTTSTKLNDRSSRSHAIFTITVHRTMIEVVSGGGGARVRTTEFMSKLHLVDLAGSERNKRSGAIGKELKEASHINSGLLALGNVISALSDNERGSSRGKAHVPYRDSKLTRLLQDSLGGNSLTVLISCISPSEMDFEETNNTLKYANRACSIKNTALPSKFTMLEEDLLPALPEGAEKAGGIGLAQLQAILNDHEKLKQLREQHKQERLAREERRLKELAALKNGQATKAGYARLRAGAYEQLRRAAAKNKDGNVSSEIADDNLVSFGGPKMGKPDSAAGPTRWQGSHPSFSDISFKAGKDNKKTAAWMAQQAKAAAAKNRDKKGAANDIYGSDSDEYDDYDDDDDYPRVLARFKVNRNDVLSVFKAITEEDFRDVMALLPQGTSLPASDKMTYLLARLEIHPRLNIDKAVQKVVDGKATMKDAVGPTVGCLMATLGTNMISSCIFDFNDPEELTYYPIDERIELWGLQIPHNSWRPSMGVVTEDDDGMSPVVWTSVDRLNMSIGLLYALCNHALDEGISCGLCVPRPQLLKRWMQAGVGMREIDGKLKLVYPSSAHDYEYYKSSTVAFFVVDEVMEGLRQVLPVVG